MKHLQDVTVPRYHGLFEAHPGSLLCPFWLGQGHETSLHLIQEERCVFILLLDRLVR